MELFLSTTLPSELVSRSNLRKKVILKLTSRNLSLAGAKRWKLDEIIAAHEGQPVLLRARLQTSRAQGSPDLPFSHLASDPADFSPLTGSKMVFIVLRQQAHTIQGLVQVEPELVSKKMVRWVEGIHSESIVLVEGHVQKAAETVKSCTVQDVELKIRKVSFSQIVRFLLASSDQFVSSHRFTSSLKLLTNFPST